MERRSDEELERLVRDNAYLNGEVAGSAAAQRILALARSRDFVTLARDWHELWPGLLAAEQRAPGARPAGLDDLINIGAAVAVLARRRAS